MQMNAMQTEKTIMTIREAAKAFNLPEFAVRNWCKCGALQHLKAGSRVYLTAGAIEDFLMKGGKAVTHDKRR